MKHLFLVLLLAAPQVAALSWDTPLDEVQHGVAVLHVRAPQDAVLVHTLDEDPSKGNGVRLERLTCSEDCLFQGFLDTTQVQAGRHTVQVGDLGTGQRVAQEFTVDNSAPFHASHVWADANNPWPSSADGPGEIRLLTWVINLGNEPSEVGIEVEALWPVEIREVSTLASHGAAASWMLPPGATQTVNVVLDIPADAHPGGDITIRSTGENNVAIAHHIDGWAVRGERSPAPDPIVVVGLILATALLARRRRP